MMTMYLSRLRLTNSRMAGLWASNPYRVHQRLLMAFDGEPRLLFRIERDSDQVQILVQSHIAPNWKRAFEKFEVLAGPPEEKTFSLGLTAGGKYRFRILANPTVKRAGKRLGLLRREEQQAWLARKLAEAGAELVSCLVKPWAFQRSERNPAKDPHLQTHVAVLFEGLLEARETTRLCAAVEEGIGSAKGFGFGLLSLARMA